MADMGTPMRMRRIDLRGAADGAPRDYRVVVPRAELDVESATHAVQPIIDAVRARGVEAILEFSAQFDGVDGADGSPVSNWRPSLRIRRRFVSCAGRPRWWTRYRKR